uniref:Secreted protein n=1 Tax=Echinococcus granulosus TaxID=6210 RepID=A0A068WU51_ECHGR|nr:hypothetical protein EgrG_002038300 [Echinococcus granulosus]
MAVSGLTKPSTSSLSDFPILLTLARAFSYTCTNNKAAPIHLLDTSSHNRRREPAHHLMSSSSGTKGMTSTTSHFPPTTALGICRHITSYLHRLLH